MHHAVFPSIDPALPGLLARLQAHADAGDEVGAAETLSAIGTERAAQPVTLVGALCLGGVALAARLMPDSCADTQTIQLVDTLDQLLAPAAGTDAATHELQCARWLAAAFSLPTPPEALLDLVRAGFLIDRGPVSELPVAIQGAMDHRQWALALRGLQRQRVALAAQAPRKTFAQAAGCLHQLGRYAEAEEWTQQGLGKSAGLLAIPPAFDEATLLRRWGSFERPRISIICTAYNHERYIEQALQGFLSQDTEFPFEVLIHDDASTDGTQGLIRRWQARYPNIIRPTLQAVNQLSRGVRPIELLLAQARGEFVATCEGDDFWVDAGKLQRQVAYLRAHADVSCTTHNHYHFVEGTLTVKPWRPARADFAISPQDLMRVRYLLWVPTLVFRKTFSTLPRERDLAAFGDQFWTSLLGTHGRGHYFETAISAVRRENAYSTWSPLPETEKDRRRAQTCVAMIRLHERLGNAAVVRALHTKLELLPLDAAVKAALLAAAPAHTEPDSLALEVS